MGVKMKRVKRSFFVHLHVLIFDVLFHNEHANTNTIEKDKREEFKNSKIEMLRE